jgi:hypothetical protein
LNVWLFPSASNKGRSSTIASSSLVGIAFMSAPVGSEISLVPTAEDPTVSVEEERLPEIERRFWGFGGAAVGASHPQSSAGAFEGTGGGGRDFDVFSVALVVSEVGRSG